MTAATAALVEANADVERLRHVVDVLDCALASQDLLTARYAAAEITCTGDRIETALLAADRAAKALSSPSLRVLAHG